MKECQKTACLRCFRREGDTSRSGMKPFVLHRVLTLKFRHLSANEAAFTLPSAALSLQIRVPYCEMLEDRNCEVT